MVPSIVNVYRDVAIIASLFFLKILDFLIKRILIFTYKREFRCWTTRDIIYQILLTTFLWFWLKRRRGYPSLNHVFIMIDFCGRSSLLSLALLLSHCKLHKITMLWKKWYSFVIYSYVCFFFYYIYKVTKNFKQYKIKNWISKFIKYS